MHIGKYSGCHQMPERSFFINGMQFPLCARCTGILAGYLVGVLLFVLKIFVPIELCLCFGLVMLGDWYMQYIETCMEFNASSALIIQKLISQFHLSEEKAQAYLNEYLNQNPKHSPL